MVDARRAYTASRRHPTLPTHRRRRAILRLGGRAARPRRQHRRRSGSCPAGGARPDSRGISHSPTGPRSASLSRCVSAQRPDVGRRVRRTSVLGIFRGTRSCHQPSVAGTFPPSARHFLTRTRTGRIAAAVVDDRNQVRVVFAPNAVGETVLASRGPTRHCSGCVGQGQGHSSQSLSALRSKTLTWVTSFSPNSPHGRCWNWHARWRSSPPLCR